MHLPLRSIFVAVTLVHGFVATNSAVAEPIDPTHYQGDYTRRPFDGSRRYDPDTDWSSSQLYRSEKQAPPYALVYDGVPLLAPIWTGIYGGIHIGGGWGTFDTTLGDVDSSGPTVGGHIGYLLRSGALVAGVEFDAGLSDVHHASNIGNNFTLVADVDWLVSARARVGVIAGPALFYATGGVAALGTSTQIGIGGFNASTSSTQTALVLGGGIEIGLNDKMAVRLEALHYFMDDERYTLPNGLGTVESGGSLTTVRAGLTFFLN